MNNELEGMEIVITRSEFYCLGICLWEGGGGTDEYHRKPC
jgi:hypothetical protein